MRLRLLFLALFICVHGYSQYEYQPGYIVKLDGQTEEGLINFRSSEFNTKKCEFKKDNNATPIIYLPNSIEAYRLIDSKYFVSKRVLIDNTDTTVFLECLISGKASIYYAQWNSLDHYYLEKEGKLVEMNNNKIDVVQDGINYQRSSNQYRGILKYNFRDCPQMSQEIDNADFSKKSLIKLSKDYHEYVCKDEQCIIYEKKVKKRHIRLGVDFSYGTTKLYFVQNELDLSLNRTNQYQFDIYSQMQLDQQGAYSLQFSLGYYSYKGESFNSEMDWVKNVYNIHYQYQFSILKPAIQLSYKIKTGKINPYVMVGIFSTLLLSDKGETQINNFIKQFNSDYGSFNFGGRGEIGFEIKPINTNFSVFYERYLSAPLTNSNVLGLKFGYYFDL